MTAVLDKFEQFTLREAMRPRGVCFECRRWHRGTRRGFHDKRTARRP